VNRFRTASETSPLIDLPFIARPYCAEGGCTLMEYVGVRIGKSIRLISGVPAVAVVARPVPARVFDHRK